MPSSSGAFIDFARSVREADVSFMLTGRGHPDWAVRNGRCGSIVIQHGRCGAGMIADGVMAQPDAVVFVMQSSLAQHAVALNGSPVAPYGIAVLPPGSAFVFANSVPHAWTSITLPVAGLAPGQIERLAGRAERPDASLVETEAEAFGRILGRVAAAPLTPDGYAPDREIAADRSEDAAGAVCDALFTAIAGADARTEPTAPHHHLIVRRSLDATAEAAGAVAPIGDLCAAAGVCERTLRRAFSAVFGMPPSRYLKLRQLNRVHAAMLDDGARGRRVTDVLTSHGVTELGRFAMQYRALFGELPSHTMRRLDHARR
ncbi:AraC family transcriptional regulator [Rhodoplanes roseus]|uniref:HTH araC/xylS-type domain-containing protein n=1 Tax=Rhodoplanes roseus TaxID=29409 RepID=A0A327L4B8_9BRAD|nr:helix-turn-helix domain-containing protein [Rhodoplanes roseus]RAI44673.1 hypothetical protein CH341_07960 [Rhodoplanes roseus]